MNWRTIPDASESVKHWSGYDPANSPQSWEDEIFSAICPKCEKASNPDECDENGLCPNCSPASLGEGWVDDDSALEVRNSEATEPHPPEETGRTL